MSKSMRRPVVATSFSAFRGLDALALQEGVLLGPADDLGEELVEELSQTDRGVLQQHVLETD